MATRSVTFIRVLSLFLSLVFLVGCDQEPKTEEEALPRWMDRTIYLAKPDDLDVNRNNAFQKERVKEALSELGSASLLGDGYFSFQEVEEGALDTSLKSGSTAADKSFILIWPDRIFDDYVVNAVNGTTPDPNAITVINSSNKRKFFIILRASCATFDSNNPGSCPNIGVGGFKAMIFRQLGLLVGLAKKDCAVSASDIMCAESPSISQYSQSSKTGFVNAFNNLLETILLNKSYYP